MKRILPVLLFLISLAFTVNAQRQVRPRFHPQTNRVLKPNTNVRIKRPLQRLRRDQQRNRTKQEAILTDTVPLKRR